jgi:preprotein translocase subunit YajC
MSEFWAGTIAVIVTTVAIFGLYWYMMFKPARRRQSKPDYRE